MIVCLQFVIIRPASVVVILYVQVAFISLPTNTMMIMSMMTKRTD